MKLNSEGGFRMDNELLVNNIKKVCTENNMTVTTLEKRLGFSPSLISRWKNNIPSVDKIVDIADFFDVTIDSLLGREAQKDTADFNDKFMETLISQTENNTLTWECLKIQDRAIKHRNIINAIEKLGFMEVLLEKEHTNWYFSTFDDISYFLLKEFKNEDDSNRAEVFFYALPDLDSRPILENKEQEYINVLYSTVYSKLNGGYDENTLHRIKHKFIYNQSSNLKESMDDKLETENINRLINSPDLIKAMEFAASPQIQQFMEIVTQPDFKDAWKMVQNLMEYKHNKKI